MRDIDFGRTPRSKTASRICRVVPGLSRHLSGPTALAAVARRGASGITVRVGPLPPPVIGAHGLERPGRPPVHQLRRIVGGGVTRTDVARAAWLDVIWNIPSAHSLEGADQ